MRTFAAEVLEALDRFEAAVRDDALGLYQRSALWEVQKELSDSRDALEELLSQIN